jgi:hypothetical protein
MLRLDNVFYIKKYLNITNMFYNKKIMNSKYDVY